MRKCTKVKYILTVARLHCRFCMLIYKTVVFTVVQTTVENYIKFSFLIKNI